MNMLSMVLIAPSTPPTCDTGAQRWGGRATLGRSSLEFRAGPDGPAVERLVELTGISEHVGHVPDRSHLKDIISGRVR